MVVFGKFVGSKFGIRGQLTKGKILYVKDKICQVRVLKDVPVVSDLTKMDFKLTLFNPISDIRLMYTPT